MKYPPKTDIMGVTGSGHRANGVLQGGQLGVIAQGVQRHVDQHPARMAKGDGLRQLLRGKITRAAARVKAGEA